MTACHIAIMAKAPLPGLAKTRLAPRLGEAGAAALAAQMLHHALAQAARADLGAVTLWGAPDLSHPAFAQAQQDHGVTLAQQPALDLGARMAHVFEQASEPLLLMGSDAPGVTATVLRQAALALSDQPIVFVPALDGGYALVGLRQPTAALLHTLFADMSWSTSQVMEQTRERLQLAGYAWTELPAVADIDEPADLAHLPAGWLPAQAAQAAPGRSCPLHYRYSPRVFASAPTLRCDTLYVVGGLYGNEAALDQVLAHFDQEPGHKRLVFNGDFNWFNADAHGFLRINQRVLQHQALRGNVETELASPESSEAGCGCAYPEWVGDGVVERSNRILKRLRNTAAQHPELTRQLANLPMWARVDVGPLRLAIVHGDAQSLAGWGFAQEHLQDERHRQTVRRWFEQAEVDAFACSHTCLPVFHQLPMAGRTVAPLVLNNGATGMPNFRADGAGLFTRVSLRPFAGDAQARRHGLRVGDVHIDAIAVDSATPAWRAQFLQLWPEHSDAHASYWQRIAQGPDFEPAQALVTSHDD